MNEVQGFEDIKKFLSLQSKAVQENCLIVDPDTMGAPYSLHIDKNTPAVFVPRMPTSAMDSENDSCPRVTVACTLLGCYIGYFRGEDDIAKGSKRYEGDTDHYRGGYVISKLAFDYALKPNENMVPDALRSEELWLVPYDQKHSEYKPVVLGKAFVSFVGYSPVSGEKPIIDITMWVEVQATEGMLLTKKILLGAGYHKVSVQWDGIHTRDINDDHNVIVASVDVDTYQQAKNLHAAMLEHDIAKRPSYLSWSSC